MAEEKPIVLVTGGAGFVGSFLCEELLKQGKRVICVDNFSSGHVRNIDPYLRNPDFQFIRQDINEPFDLEAFPELEPFKVQFLGIAEIYHMAILPSVKHFEKFRVPNLLVNAIGLRHILDIAVKYKSKFVLGSSSVVYGPRTAEVTRFSEDYEGVVPHLEKRSAYDEGRRFAETMTYTYGDVYGIDAKIARIFRTYGPRMPLFEGYQVPDFVVSALNGEDLTVHGGEAFQTSLIYVRDVVEGLLRLMAAPKGTTPVNIGSGHDVKIADVAKKIIEMTDSSSKVAFAGEMEFLSQLGLPDISKAKEELEWAPVTRLEDGLEKTINYIRANKILLTGEE